jgi:hypothetical protein
MILSNVRLIDGTGKVWERAAVHGVILDGKQVSGF